MSFGPKHNVFELKIEYPSWHVSHESLSWQVAHLLTKWCVLSIQSKNT